MKFLKSPIPLYQAFASFVRRPSLEWASHRGYLASFKSKSSFIAFPGLVLFPSSLFVPVLTLSFCAFLLNQFNGKWVLLLLLKTDQGLLSLLITMKRTMPWSDDDDDSSSDESSSHSDSEHNSETGEKKSQGKSRKQKRSVIDFEALKRHGFKGGPSVLNVPLPKEGDNLEPDWSWSTGKERRVSNESEESYEERQKTRAAVSLGEQLSTVQTPKEKKNISFSQKEKRKRELGQASRGKNYVEEEKRLLRESGIYSGFDT